MSFVYVQSERGYYESLWTVGFYDPNGKWHSESDHTSSQAAAARVHYLNGGRADVAEEVREQHAGDV